MSGLVLDTKVSNFSNKDRLQKGKLKDSIPSDTLEGPIGI